LYITTEPITVIFLKELIGMCINTEKNTSIVTIATVEQKDISKLEPEHLIQGRLYFGDR
jgi:hypothetical protein